MQSDAVSKLGLQRFRTETAGDGALKSEPYPFSHGGQDYLGHICYRQDGEAPDRRYGFFAIILGSFWDHFSRISQVRTSLHALCDGIYLAPMPIGADWCIATR